MGIVSWYNTITSLYYAAVFAISHAFVYLHKEGKSMWVLAMQMSGPSTFNTTQLEIVFNTHGQSLEFLLS